jgi:hypothetical protein
MNLAVFGDGVHHDIEVLVVSFLQEYVPTDGGPAGEDTWRVSTATELLQVYVNFLRGKVHLLLSGAQACQQDVS